MLPQPEIDLCIGQIIQKLDLVLLKEARYCKILENFCNNYIDAKISLIKQYEYHRL